MFEIYFEGAYLKIILVAILELDLHCKLLTKIKGSEIVFGFGTCTLDIAETITSLLILLRVPFECE